MRIRFDIECDGLLDTVTKVHVLSLRVDGYLTKRYVGHAAILKALNYINKSAPGGAVLVAHNGIAFDFIALYKVLKWKPSPRLVIEDTFVESALMHADMAAEDGSTGMDTHGLEEWGKRLGEHKTDYQAAYKDWAKAEWDAEHAHEYADDHGSTLEASSGLSLVIDRSTYRYHEGDEWREYNPVMGSYCDQDVAVLVKLDEQFLKERAEYHWESALATELRFAQDFAVQGMRGVGVDRELAEKLIAEWTAEMEALEKEVEPLLPPRRGTVAELHSVTPPKLCFKKDGTLCKATADWFESIRLTEVQTFQGLFRGVWHDLPTPMQEDGSGRVPLVDMFPARLADQQHIKQWLMDMGWRPTLWSFQKKKDKNGKLRLVRGDDGEPVPTWPKFHDKGLLCKALEEIKTEFPHVNKVVRWIIVRHRRGLIQSIVDAIRPDGRVSATGFALGTPTSRVTHRVVANFPKAEKDVPLGHECRSTLIECRGVMTGVDASGLELRCLAHYVDNPTLTHIIVNGTKENGDEIHTVLWKACNPLVPSRSVQKNVTYGWLYGASDKKLGQTAGHPDAVAKKVGGEIRRRMIESIPGLEDLMVKVEKAAKRGCVIAIDGRKIKIRSKHATLNTLLQSCGSILVKMAQNHMNSRIKIEGLQAWQVISYHDEVQLDCAPESAARAGFLFVEGLRLAGQAVGFKVPLDGEVKYGLNWAETH